MNGGQETWLLKTGSVYSRNDEHIDENIEALTARIIYMIFGLW